MADHSEMTSKHKISDFDLDRLGAVLCSEAETDHNGYVIVKSHAHQNIETQSLSDDRRGAIEQFAFPTTTILCPKIDRLLSAS
jgi:hypothetical protein